MEWEERVGREERVEREAREARELRATGALVHAATQLQHEAERAQRFLWSTY